jgi:MFS family permease
LTLAGITEKNASWLLMPVVLAMAFGSPTAGRLLDKFGSKTVILSGTSLTVIGLFLLSLVTGSLPAFIVAGLFIGLGLSALLGAPLRYITLNETRPAERSTAQGVVALFASIGQLIGAVLVGAVAASGAQTDPAAGYVSAFLVVAAVSLVLVFASLALKDRSAEQSTVKANETA